MPMYAHVLAADVGPAIDAASRPYRAFWLHRCRVSQVAPACVPPCEPTVHELVITFRSSDGKLESNYRPMLNASSPACGCAGSTFTKGRGLVEQEPAQARYNASISRFMSGRVLGVRKPGTTACTGKKRAALQISLSKVEASNLTAAWTCSTNLEPREDQDWGQFIRGEARKKESTKKYSINQGIRK